jgi:hypothetical protein
MQSHRGFAVILKILLSDVIATLAVASLLAQFSDNVPEDSRLHVIDLVQAVHAAPVGAG